MSRLGEAIRRMPREQREAVEDAVMRLLKTNREYGDAYDASPAGMPHATGLANNAYERQAKGERGSAVETAEALSAARQFTRTDPEQDARHQARWERSASLGSPAPAEVGPTLRKVGDEPYSGVEFIAMAKGSSRAIRAVETAEALSAAREITLSSRVSPVSSESGASLLGPEGVKAVYDTQSGSRSRTRSSRPTGSNASDPLRKRPRSL